MNEYEHAPDTCLIRISLFEFPPDSQLNVVKVYYIYTSIAGGTH